MENDQEKIERERAQEKLKNGPSFGLIIPEGGDPDRAEYYGLCEPTINQHVQPEISKLVSEADNHAVIRINQPVCSA